MTNADEPDDASEQAGKYHRIAPAAGRALDQTENERAETNRRQHRANDVEPPRFLIAALGNPPQSDGDDNDR